MKLRSGPNRGSRLVAAGLAIAFSTASSVTVAQALNSKETETRRIVAAYGSCMVLHRHDRLKAFVLSQTDVRPPSPIDTCVVENGTLRMSGWTYRMVFAEALVKHDFPDALPAALIPDPNAIPAVAGDPALVFTRLEVVGRCTARRNPTGSLQWLRSRLGSDEEGAGARALLPTLKACGVAWVLPQNIDSIRGAVAVNLYRAAVEAADASSAKGN